MNDKQLVNQVIERLCEEYNLVVLHPYDDDFIQLVNKDTNDVMLEMNPKGRNLLTNLSLIVSGLDGLTK